MDVECVLQRIQHINPPQRVKRILDKKHHLTREALIDISSYYEVPSIFHGNSQVEADKLHIELLRSVQHAERPMRRWQIRIAFPFADERKHYC
ncbi:hypothetical protein J6590_095403 [Homalodisca vitripennis]|nr:hypothetical protein J6590_095403 [Homalodisca vitripennis]